MRNYIQPGEVMDYVNGNTPRQSGDLIDVGDRVCVAAVDIGKNATGSAAASGVFDLPAGALSAAVKQGQTVYSDGSGKITDSDGTGANVAAGYAFVAAAKTDASVAVALNA